MDRRYEFGPFVLDAEARVLLHEGQPATLGARAVSVLALLVARAPNPVPKTALLDAAWPTVVVEENNLAVQVSAIRRSLAAAPGGNGWIETLSGRGYRYVGPAVQIREPTGPRAGPLAPPVLLPESASAFIGRDREIEAIAALLDRHRLVTIIGAGGIGKTRLALRVAALVADRFADGVALVELASISDPTLVAATFAQSLGVQDRPARALVDVLRVELAQRRMLIVVDNCEHVIDAAAKLLAALVSDSTGPVFLATSREPLRVDDEQLFPLAPLGLPDAEANAAAIAESEAVRLFVERARRLQPDFALTPSRATVVAELCRHLDGIPLALELAAARVRALSVEQIADRLDDRFRLLTAGPRERMPRQQTLRAAFDWSWDLLPETERAVFRRLAAFPATFALDAACAVAADDGLDEFAIVDVVSQLVARSLVVAVTDEAETRYHLLETARAYALEKLGQAGDVEHVRNRHAAYFRDVGERAADEWMTLAEPAWRQRYLPDSDNFRAALDGAFGDGRAPAIAIARASATAPLWNALSRVNDALRWMSAAADLVDETTSPVAAARLWLVQGNTLQQSDPKRALPPSERAVAAYRALGDRRRLAESLIYLSRVHVRHDRLDEADAALAEAGGLLRRNDPPQLLGFLHSNRSFLMQHTNDLAGALADDEAALAQFRRSGGDWIVVSALGVIADKHWMMGQLDAALAEFREEIASLRSFRSPRRRSLGFALANLAGLHAERGELDAALDAAREALPMIRSSGTAWMFADHFALRLGLAGRIEDAARLQGFADAAYSGRSAQREPNEARAQERIVRLLRQALPGGEVDALLAEGRTLDDEAAWRLAVVA